MQDRPRKTPQRMVRKQFLITPEQNRRLKARARALRCAEGELIRAAIDREVGDNRADDWKRRLLAVAGALKHEEGLEERVAANRARWSKRVDAIGRKLRGEE
ncbi:MAG: hypothetical protein F9K44_08100 [Hyphomicrobiaceae bacterium]|nr:MAG: hypothetical protein F9K44_08100 [Hyphomicrobiaceae bacterium]